jgi:hypothetical protein
VSSQREFDVESGGNDHGYNRWLAGGIRLRGKLRVQKGVLYIEEARVGHLGLVVDQVAFAYRGMESCVRLD